jgi:hypothetical protein
MTMSTLEYRGTPMVWTPVNGGVVSEAIVRLRNLRARLFTLATPLEQWAPFTVDLEPGDATRYRLICMPLAPFAADFGFDERDARIALLVTHMRYYRSLWSCESGVVLPFDVAECIEGFVKHEWDRAVLTWWFEGFYAQVQE